MTTRTPPSGWLSRLAQGSLVKQILIGLVLGVLLALVSKPAAIAVGLLGMIFPLMVGLAAVAQPLVLLLLTEKWMMAAVLLQILCFDWMFDHLSIINLNLLYVKGRSDWALRMEIIKKTIATLILFASIPFGIEGMCWGRVLYSLIAAYLNSYYTKSLIGLSFMEQVKDIYPSLLLALFMGGVVFISIGFITHPALQLLAGILIGSSCYLFISYWLHFEALHEILSMVKR